jgi:hypothetical protein
MTESLADSFQTSAFAEAFVRQIENHSSFEFVKDCVPAKFKPRLIYGGGLNDRNTHLIIELVIKLDEFVYSDPACSEIIKNVTPWMKRHGFEPLNKGGPVPGYVGAIRSAIFQYESSNVNGNLQMYIVPAGRSGGFIITQLTESPAKRRK